MIKLLTEWLPFAVIGFISIGLEEALIKPAAKKFFKRKVIKYAPVAMEFLDQQMPRMMRDGTGSAMHKALMERLEVVSGESWKSSEVDHFFGIYDPRITADKHPAS